MSSIHLVLSRVFFLRANYRKYKKMINPTDLVTEYVALCAREDSKKITEKVNSKHGDMKDYFPSLQVVENDFQHGSLFPALTTCKTRFAAVT